MTDGAPIPMHEPLMSKFGIPERAQPALVLRSPTGWGVWIKPRALWVAGANGRIDIYSKKGVFTLIDIAES